MIPEKLFWLGALVSALLALSGCSWADENSSLLLGGDVFLARAGEQLYSSEVNPWGDLLSLRQELEESFLAVNLESPFGRLPEDLDAEALSMNLCAPAEAIDLLTKAEVNLATTANNHAQDCVNSEVNSDAILDQAGIAHTDQQSGIIYQEVSGRTVAFLALDDLSKSYDLDVILSQIQRSDQESDLVVVSVHWGQEYQTQPNQRQKDLAKQLADAGADIIWGHHPHVLQPVQWLESTKDGRETLVMYSLGNLLTDQWMLQDAQKTVLVKVEFNDNGIQKVEILPFRMDLKTRGLVLEQDEVALTWWVNRLELEALENEIIETEIQGFNPR